MVGYHYSHGRLCGVLLSECGSGIIDDEWELCMQYSGLTGDHDGSRFVFLRERSHGIGWEEEESGPTICLI